MELDGYNSDVAIAFEYQGQQHSKFIEFFHKSHEEFELRIEDDKIKKELCFQNNILLISIDIEIPLQKLQEYIFNVIEQIVILNKMKLNKEKFWPDPMRRSSCYVSSELHLAPAVGWPA